MFDCALHLSAGGNFWSNNFKIEQFDQNGRHCVWREKKGSDLHSEEVSADLQERQNDEGRSGTVQSKDTFTHCPYIAFFNAFH